MYILYIEYGVSSACEVGVAECSVSSACEVGMAECSVTSACDVGVAECSVTSACKVGVAECSVCWGFGVAAFVSVMPLCPHSLLPFTISHLLGCSPFGL